MDTGETLKLDNQICFLLYAGSRKMTAVYAPLLEKLGLTYPQYLVMLVLWEKDGVDVGYISGRLLLDTGTLSPLLKKMQGSGFIERKRDPGDERKVILTLTDKGKSLKDRALDIPRTVFAKSGFSADEYQMLKNKLAALLDRIGR
ncbi:MAG: MarR family winged helix-turn-helix transcriptional regulator [Spirochaetota bacterium]